MSNKQSSNSTNSQNPFGPDAFKAFQNFSAPGIDFEELMTSQRKNLEALTHANQMAIETAKAISQAQTQYARQTMEDTAAFLRDWMSSGANVQDKIDLQSQSIQEGISKAVAHGQEVSGVLHKSQEKIIKLSNNRLNECVKEATNIAKKTARKAS